MEWVQQIISQLSGTGNMLLLAVMVCVVGLLLKQKFAKALKSGLLIAIGFLGINVLSVFVCQAMGAVISVLGSRGSYTVVDIGWQALAASAWVLPFSIPLVVGIYALNVLLIRRGWTRTLNTDVWDYCHILFAAGISYVVFDSVLAAVAVGLLSAVITLKAGDRIAKRWVEHTEAEGTTASVVFHVTTMFPFYYLCDRIIDRIPLLKKVEISCDRLVSKVRVVGDPIFMGFLMGSGLGIAAGLKAAAVLQLGFSIALSMVLAGRIVALIVEGINPLSAAAKQWALKRIGDNPQLLIGVDFSLGQGDPGAINASVLMIPVAIVLAVILPGVSFFPTSLIPNLIVYTCVGSLACRSNAFRVMIGSVVLIIFMLYAQTWMVPLTTELIAVAGIHTPCAITGGSSASLIAVAVAAVGKLFGTW